MEDKNDHTILVQLNERVKNIENLLKNHLSHHWAITMWLLGITSTTVIAIILLIIRDFFLKI